MNRDFYEMARKRCMSKPPFGTKIITDADIIFMQEEEIESYRKKVASYMAADMNKKLETLSIKDELSRMADKNKQLKKEIDILKGKLAYCESELAEKKAECMELDSDNVKLQQEIDSYKESIKLRVGDFIRFGEIKYKIVKATVKPDGIVTAVAFECLEQAE